MKVSHTTSCSPNPIIQTRDICPSFLSGGFHVPNPRDPISLTFLYDDMETNFVERAKR